MVEKDSLKQDLDAQKLYYQETDLRNVNQILTDIKEAEASLNNFPDLKEEIPISIYDKGEIMDD